MTSTILYFQLHQPWRLRPYSVFDTDPHYFRNDLNEEVWRRAAERCYRPVTSLLLDLVKRHEGRFRLGFSITGTALEQMEAWTPDVLDLFRRLVETGCCELLAETHHHSLAFLYSREEFVEQVDMHTARIEALFGVTPRVFRNTELIYNNDLAYFVHGMKDASGAPRFKGALTEGVEGALRGRTTASVYRPPHTGDGPGGRPFGLLLKNHRLSDDIAFRFANRSWSEWPLTPAKFARWIDSISETGDEAGGADGCQTAPAEATGGAAGPVCCLFMDYETFGEHHWAETGVLRFLEELPGAVLGAGDGKNDFCTPGEAFDRFDAADVYDSQAMISWADSERDLSAWLGNAMQSNALYELHKLERCIRQRSSAAGASGDEESTRAAAALLEDWRRLTTSDHFYYMCTKESGDGAVHRHFSPYESPYDSYINFMNVLDHIRTRVASA